MFALYKYRTSRRTTKGYIYSVPICPTAQRSNRLVETGIWKAMLFPGPRPVTFSSTRRWDILFFHSWWRVHLAKLDHVVLAQLPIPFYKPIASKKECAFNVKVVKATMNKLANGKVEFQRLEQAHICIDDRNANVRAVNSAV